jgi:general secretion pathway protein C
MSRFHPHRWFERARTAFAHPHTPNVAALALVMLLGWQLAGVTWAMLPPVSEGQAQPEPATRDAQTPSASQQRDAAAVRLARLHLFGEKASETSEQPERAQKDAPETQLDLTLKGLYAPGDGNGFAIISAGGGAEQVYAVDDTLAGGARIRGIYANRVVLRRNGRDEILRLAGTEAPDGQTTTASANTAANGSSSATNQPVTTDPEAIAERAREFRQRLNENPLELARMVRFQPQMQDGELIGYRIKARAMEPDRLRDLGLRKTDVVTRINGVALDDPEQANQALQELRNAETINVTLMRDGRRQSVSIPIGRPG